MDLDRLGVDGGWQEGGGRVRSESLRLSLSPPPPFYSPDSY